MWYLLSKIAPGFYRRAWNREFINGMEKLRLDLYEKYHPRMYPAIDERIEQSYQMWLKKPGQ